MKKTVMNSPFGPWPALVETGIRYTVRDINGNEQSTFVPDQELPMNTPTEAQLNDPKWWDENDPLGDSKKIFIVEERGAFKRLRWCRSLTEGPQLRGFEMADEYRRPKVLPEHNPWNGFDGGLLRKDDKDLSTPPALEWDGNTIIAAGHRLEARVDKNPWLSGEVAYRSDSGVVFRPDDGGDELFWRFALFNVEFRPIRTKEQRERNMVENKALDAVYSRISDDHLVRTIKETVAALYDAGMLRKAGGE